WPSPRSVSTTPCCSSPTSNGRFASTRKRSAWRSSRANPERPRLSYDCPGPATTTTSACSGSAPPAARNAERPSGCITWPGRWTPSRSSPTPVSRCSAPMRTPVSRATAPPRACTAPTLTATSSRSCGCFRGRSGGCTRAPPPLTPSTSPARSAAGPASARQAGSSPRRSEGNR
ncbi:MAG: Biphenyl-2,3-diol 1,2-dioxygenase, partial [uncultured Acidimicrobiales bacterium]